MKEYLTPLERGRNLNVREDGDLAGFPIFALHGSPGCRILLPSHVAHAAATGIRLIGFDRPGYGGSTRVEGRRIVDAARDVEAIADHLGVERFGVWGVSGGGAPALPCAACLPKRVVASVSLAGVAPFDAPGLDWYAGMGESNIEDFKLMLENRPAWEAKSRKDRQDLLDATPAQLEALWSALLSDVDRAGFTAEVKEFLVNAIQDGLRESDAGMVDDSISQCLPWGFDLDVIRVPTQVWHGDQDRFVPFGHGQWLAAHVPGTEAHLLPGGGMSQCFTIMFRTPSPGSPREFDGSRRSSPEPGAVRGTVGRAQETCHRADREPGLEFPRPRAEILDGFQGVTVDVCRGFHSLR